MLALLLATLIGQSTKKDAPKVERPKPTLTPVADYRPKVGDTITAYSRQNGALVDVMIAPNIGDWQQLQTCSLAKDTTGLAKLLMDKAAFYLDSGTELKIVEIGQGGVTERRVGPGVPDGFGKIAYRYEYDQEPLLRWYAVRVMDGPMKDQLMFVDKKLATKCELIYPKPPKRKKK